MPIASNSLRVRCSNSPGERASRSGRLSRPAMTSISSTNLYFDRSNFRTGSTGYQVPGVRGDQRVEVAAQARLRVQLRFVQHDLGEGVPHGLDAEQQRPDRLAGGAVLGRDVAVEHDPADQRDRGDVERLGQRAQRHPADQLLIQLVDLRWLARLGLDEVLGLHVPVAGDCGDDLLPRQLVLHPQLTGFRDVPGRARPVQALRVHRGRQRLLDRRHERVRAMRVESGLGAAAVRDQVTVAVGQQPLERGDRSPHGLGPELGFSHPPFHRPAAPVRLAGLLVPALGGLPLLLLAGLGCRLPLLLPYLLAASRSAFAAACCRARSACCSSLSLAWPRVPPPGAAARPPSPPEPRPCVLLRPTPGRPVLPASAAAAWPSGEPHTSGRAATCVWASRPPAGRSTSRPRQTAIRFLLNVTDKAASSKSPPAPRTRRPRQRQAGQDTYHAPWCRAVGNALHPGSG